MDLHQYFSSDGISPSDILDDPSLIPNEVGIYGWYFHRWTVPYLPIEVLPDADENGWMCLYIGIAAKQTLQTRIHKLHIKGGPHGSTLKHSLFALLSEQAGKTVTRDDAMNALLAAKVRYRLCKKPEEIETALLRYNTIPLNLRRNRQNPFRRQLSVCRSRWGKQWSH